MQKLYNEYMVAKENIREELYSKFLEFLKEKDISFLVENFMFCEVEDEQSINFNDYLKKDKNTKRYKINEDYLKEKLDEVKKQYSSELYELADDRFLAEKSEELIVEFIKSLELSDLDQYFFYFQTLKNGFWSDEDWESYVKIDIGSKGLENKYCVPVSLIVDEGNIESKGKKLGKSLNHIKDFIYGKVDKINESKIDDFTKELFRQQGINLNNYKEEKFNALSFSLIFEESLKLIGDRAYYVFYNEYDLKSLRRAVEKDCINLNNLDGFYIYYPDKKESCSLSLKNKTEYKISNMILSNKNNPSIKI